MAVAFARRLAPARYPDVVASGSGGAIFLRRVEQRDKRAALNRQQGVGGKHV